MTTDPNGKPRTAEPCERSRGEGSPSHPGPPGGTGAGAVQAPCRHQGDGVRMLALGKIGPRPIRLSAGCVRYDLGEVLAWLRHRRPDGALHDGEGWPGVWAALCRNGGEL